MTSLIELASNLIELHDELGDKDYSDEEIDRLLEAETNVRRKVDGWIDFLALVKSQIKMNEDLKAKYDKKRKSLKNLQARLKDRLKYCIEANPTVVYRGDNGAIELQTGPPSMIVSEDFITKSVTMVPEGVVPHPHFIYDYCTKVNVLDKETLKKALLSGGIQDTFLAGIQRKQTIRIK